MNSLLHWRRIPEALENIVALPEDSAALGSIKVTGLRAGYGPSTVFEEFDLDVAPGEFVYLVGSSGAGKSTLLNLLFGGLRPSRGKIRVDGVRVDRLHAWQVSEFRRRVGCVFQGYELLPQLTALENVVLPLQLSHPRLLDPTDFAADALNLVGLGAKLGARPGELSGGQQQRVAIARAIAHEPRVLLADEPTGNIDRRTSEEIVEIFRQLNALGSTVLMSTHDDLAREFHQARTVSLTDEYAEGAA